MQSHCGFHAPHCMSSLCISVRGSVFWTILLILRAPMGHPITHDPNLYFYVPWAHLAHWKDSWWKSKMILKFKKKKSFFFLFAVFQEGGGGRALWKMMQMEPNLVNLILTLYKPISWAGTKFRYPKVDKAHPGSYLTQNFCFFFCHFFQSREPFSLYDGSILDFDCIFVVLLTKILPWSPLLMILLLNTTTTNTTTTTATTTTTPVAGHPSLNNPQKKNQKTCHGTPKWIK